MKVAIIDIGSNTVRMNIYRIKNNQYEVLISKKYMLGLASYIEEGVLIEAGYSRLKEVVSSFKEFCDIFSVENAHYFATASLRNVSNNDQVIGRICAETGVLIELLSQEDEGRYDFLGTTLSKNGKGYLIDIGGGSSEVVAYEDNKILYNVCFSKGSLNSYTANVKDVTPKKEEIKKIDTSIKKTIKAIDKFEEKFSKNAIGIGGSIRAIHLLISDLYKKTENQITKKEIDKILELYDEDRQAFIKKMLRIKPERIHTIIPGMIILLNIMDEYKISTINVSKTGLREGYLISKYDLQGENR